MALPQPTYPPVRPSGFADPQETITRAVELYARYHPAAMQQRMYQAILQDESWKGAQNVEKMRIIAEERASILENLSTLEAARIRGAARGAGGGGGGGGGSRKASSDLAYDLSRLELDRLKNIDTHDRATAKSIEKEFGLTSEEYQFIGRVKNTFARAQAREVNNTQLGNAIERSLEEFLDTPYGQEVSLADPQQANKLAAGLYTALHGLPENVFTALGSQTALGQPALTDPNAAKMNVAAKIDEWLGHENYIQGVLARGDSPESDQQMKKRARLEAGTSELAGVDVREVMQRMSGLSTPAGGAGAPGTGAGLSTPATTEGDVEALLRSRLGMLDTELSALQGRPSPATMAARRTLGWEGGVSPEAFEAASSSHPVAGELLAGALGRVSRAGGRVEPETDVEKMAQRLINSDPSRNFQSFWEGVVKMYPRNTEARKQAGEYFGAYYYALDAQGQTLNPGVLEAKPEIAAQNAPVIDMSGVGAQALDPGAEFLRQVQALPAEVDVAQAHTLQ
jgi:hypothetical protein